MLPSVLSNLAQISQCADHNQEVLQAIIHNSLHMFENIEYGERVRLDLHQVVSCTYTVYMQVVFSFFLLFTQGI